MSARVAPSPMESTDESVGDSEVEVDTLRAGKEGEDTPRRQEGAEGHGVLATAPSRHKENDRDRATNNDGRPEGHNDSGIAHQKAQHACQFHVARSHARRIDGLHHEEHQERPRTCRQGVGERSEVDLLEDEGAVDAQLRPQRGEYSQHNHSGNDEAVRNEPVFQIDNRDSHEQRASDPRYDDRHSPTELQVKCREERPHDDLNRDDPCRYPLGTVPAPAAEPHVAQDGHEVADRDATPAFQAV